MPAIDPLFLLSRKLLPVEEALVRTTFRVLLSTFVMVPPEPGTAFVEIHVPSAMSVSTTK